MNIILILLSLTTLLAQVHIQDVQVLTLYQGDYTTGRRSAPVPQLRCVGGTAMSEGYRIKSMQCHNQGFDGHDANWKCDAEVPNNMKLGRVTVNCEGYEFPEDPHILIGSCGAEYELSYVAHSSPHRDVTVTTWFDPFTGMYYNTYSHGGEVMVIFWLLMLLIALALLSSCLDSYNHRRSHYVPTPYPSYSWWGPSWFWRPHPVSQTTFSSGPSSSGSHQDTSFAQTRRR